MAITRRSGFTAQTAAKLIFDAGELHVNYGESNARKIGATRGGAAFTIEVETRQVEVDGAVGPMKGLTRIISVSPMLTCTLIEFDEANLAMVLPGSSTSDETNYKEITRSENLGDNDYLDNISLVTSVGSKTHPCVCMVKNALQTGPFNLQVEHNNEGGVELEFTGHFLTSSFSDEPWEIRWPTS